jgi:uridine kinase
MFKTTIKLFVAMTALWPLMHSMENVEKANAQVLQPLVERAKLLALKKDNKLHPPFIAITGCSSVGKSHLTQELACLLKLVGIKVAILRLDDFLDPDYNDPHHFHPLLMHQLAHEVIQKILKGEKFVRKPAWNPEELQPPWKTEENFSVEGIDLILFEGEFTWCADEPYNFKQYSEFGIFVDAQDADILGWDWIRQRRIVKQTEEEFLSVRGQYLQKYRNYIASVPETASYLLLKNENHSYKLHIQHLA